MLTSATLAGCVSSGYETDAVDYSSPTEYNKVPTANPEYSNDDGFPMDAYAGLIAVASMAGVGFNEALKAFRRFDDREADRQNNRTT